MTFLSRGRNGYGQANQHTKEIQTFQTHLTSSRSRDDRAATIHRFLSTNHELRRMVVVLADIFKQFLARAPTKDKARIPGRGVCAGIIDHYFVFQIVHIQTCEAFEKMELLRMRRSFAVHPEPLVKSHSIDDERVAFPAADRVSVVARLQILGMLAA